MTTTIGIIGLGQIGASIGLALRARGDSGRILGHDKDGAVARAAEAMGAVDGTSGLKGLVRDSQLVFLCLPLAEMEDVLGRIGPDLNDNAVVIDTSPVKSQVIRWAGASLPPGRYYLGVVPAINAALLRGTEGGIKAARVELFQRTVMMVVRPPGTPAAVEELGMNVARILGAKPMLIDPAEADGIMTTAHILPQLVAAALIEASMGTGGWLEARKLASRPFIGVSGGMAYYDDPKSIEAAVLSNPSRVVHGLDVLIAALQGLRDDIGAQHEAQIGERLGQSFEAREQWLDERNEAGWLTEGHEPVKLPGLSEHITQMLFGGKIADASRQPEPKREGRK